MLNADPSAANVNIPAQSRKAQKTNARPRGRPPGLNKFSRSICKGSKVHKNYHDPRRSLTSNPYIFSQGSDFSSSCCFNTLLEPNLLVPMLESALNADPALKFHSTYKDILQQYQNNLNPVLNLNIEGKKMSFGHMFDTRKAVNAITSRSSLSNAEEKSDISITPVIANIPDINPECSKFTNRNDAEHEHAERSMQYPIAVKNESSQLSIIKPSYPQRATTLLPTGNRIAPAALSLSDNLTTNHKSLFREKKTVIPTNNVTHCISRGGTSLQHKLLSKKQIRRSHAAYADDATHSEIIASRNYTNLISSEIVSYACSDINSVAVSTLVPTKSSELHPVYGRKPNTPESKIDNAQIASSSTKISRNCISVSVLSQLKQQSHLEIIPQASNLTNLPRNLNCGSKLVDISERPTGEQSSIESMKFSKTQSTSMYEVPQNQANTSVQSNKLRKSQGNNVEVITLDD